MTFDGRQLVTAQRTATSIDLFELDPLATAVRVRDGGLQLGEYFEYTDGGWWWVHY